MPVASALAALVVAALVLVAALSGCGGDDPATVQTTELAGALVEMSPCKTSATAPLLSQSGEDCLEWSHDGAGVLTLRHVNAAFNCCPEYDVTVGVREATITVTERETAGLCGCLCLYDLTFRVTGLPPGVYAIEIDQEYLEPGEPVHRHSLDLTGPGSGSLCIARTHYPWSLD